MWNVFPAKDDECVSFSLVQVVAYNCIVTFSFLLGMAFTYFDFYCGNFNLDAKDVKAFSWKLILLAIVLVCIILSILGYLAFIWIMTGLYIFYGILIAVFIIGVIWYTFLYPWISGYQLKFHMHHYFLALCGISILGY